MEDVSADEVEHDAAVHTRGGVGEFDLFVGDFALSGEHWLRKYAGFNHLNITSQIIKILQCSLLGFLHPSQIQARLLLLLWLLSLNQLLTASFLELGLD